MRSGRWSGVSWRIPRRTRWPGRPAAFRPAPPETPPRNPCPARSPRRHWSSRPTSTRTCRPTPTATPGTAGISTCPAPGLSEVATTISGTAHSDRTTWSPRPGRCSPSTSGPRGRGSRCWWSLPAAGTRPPTASRSPSRPRPSSPSDGHREAGDASAAAGADDRPAVDGRVRGSDLGLAPAALRPRLRGRARPARAGGGRAGLRSVARRDAAVLARPGRDAVPDELPLRGAGLRRRDRTVLRHDRRSTTPADGRPAGRRGRSRRRGGPGRGPARVRRGDPPVTVALVGAAESDLGVTGLSSIALQTQAVTRALTDAGLPLSDVDGLATTGL